MLQGERDKAYSRALAEPTVFFDLDDEMLMRTHKVISETRKEMAGRVFVAYQGQTLRVWWLKSPHHGISAIVPLHLDSHNLTSKLTLSFKVVHNQEMIAAIHNTFQGAGWTCAPHKYYLDLIEKITISLPFKIIFPKNPADLKKLRSTGPNYTAYDFQIASVMTM